MQQVSTLSRKSSPSERTIFEWPTLKEGSFPAFEALFQKYGSALPAAIRRPQGGYYHKGSITEHVFRTAYKQFCKLRQLGMGNDLSKELGSRKSGGYLAAHSEAWNHVTCDTFMLGSVQGHLIQFNCKPRLVHPTDLKPLNQYIKCTKFKMTTLKQIRESLRNGQWAVQMDIKLAYCHVLMHHRHRCFLHF